MVHKGKNRWRFPDVETSGLTDCNYFSALRLSRKQSVERVPFGVQKVSIRKLIVKYFINKLFYNLDCLNGHYN